MNARIDILGAGLMGMGLAWRLSQRGFAVTLWDPAGAGMETSRVSAGMLAPRAEVHPGEDDLLRFAARSQKLWPSWAAELSDDSGVEVPLRMPGTLAVAMDDDERRQLEASVAWHRAEGVPVEPVSTDTVRDEEPDLSRNIVAAVRHPGDGQVDNRAALDALRASLKRRNVEIRAGQRITRVATRRQAVVRIVDDRGEEHATELVVIAAGAWSRRVLVDDLPPLPVRPVRGQILAFRGVDRNGREVRIRHAIHTPNVYLAQKADGTVLVGATMEECGFDRAISTGGMFQNLREGRRLLPCLDDLPFIEARIGFRPTTRDNRPLIGATDVDGLFCLTGHFRNGIQQAPASIDSLVDEILTGRIAEDVRPFSPRRFSSSQGTEDLSREPCA